MGTPKTTKGGPLVSPAAHCAVTNMIEKESFSFSNLNLENLVRNADRLKNLIDFSKDK